MDWQRRYGDKVRDAAGAILAIEPGRRILIGSGAAEPGTLVEAMVEHGRHLADNDIVHLMTLGPAPYCAPGTEDRFRHTAFFIGQNVREAVAEGRADFMPVFLSEIPRLIRSRRVGIDVALIQVSPPDAHGYVSLGVSVDIVRAAVDTADLILAEVNPRMPRTLGDSFLHVDQIRYLVPVDKPLPEVLPAGDETSEEIGRQVAGLIPDGATLQMGIGKIPDAVLRALSGRNDLGVHTEMFSDGVVDLIEQGVITGRKKTLLPGKVVSSFVMGTERLYEKVHDHPMIEMRSTGFTNDPQVIARNERMMAINSALAVDLTGQVAADTLAGRFFSGIGGQVDFVRGAARSVDGKAIIALPSTAKRGTVSRIQATFEPGAGVVTSRGDVHYVVTEFGVADLWGKSIRERALALTEIAHPDFRGELMDAAKARRYVFPDQPVPRVAYPWSESRRLELESGEEVLLRPLRQTDQEPLQEMLYRLSDETIYRRFLAHKRVHPRRDMEKLVDLDFEQNMALLAVREQGDREEILGMCRYDVDPATRMADIAFIVDDRWQGKGLGTALMSRMAEIARSRGLRGFTADVLASNKPMIQVFQNSGLEVSTSREQGSVHLKLRFKLAPERRPRGWA